MGVVAATVANSAQVQRKQAVMPEDLLPWLKVEESPTEDDLEARSAALDRLLFGGR